MPATRIDGIALAAAGAGALFTYAGIRDKSVLSVVTGLVQGNAPSAAAAAGAGLGGSAGSGVPGTGAGPGGLAAKFMTYAGKVPYLWAGATPKGWDCSGSCNYVVNVDSGIGIPEFAAPRSLAGHGPATETWLEWAAAGHMAKLKESESLTNDIVLWETHMGVITRRDAQVGLHYVSAYDTAEGTVEKPVHGGGPWGEIPSFWRLNVTATPAPHHA